jgi:hypothetical protein
MIISDWLESRLPAPPPALAERMRALLGADADASADEVHDVLASASERALRDLLARGDHSRAIAQDLLAIDALVTYACEAAAESWEKRGAADADTLTAWCEEFAEQLARAGSTATFAARGEASAVRSDVAGPGEAAEIRSDAGLLRREDLGGSSGPSNELRG